MQHDFDSDEIEMNAYPCSWYPRNLGRRISLRGSQQAHLLNSVKEKKVVVREDEDIVEVWVCWPMGIKMR